MSNEDSIRGATRSVIKLLIAVIGLLLLRAMLALLPGGERSVPGTDVELETVLVALFMLLVAGVILYYGYQLSRSTGGASYSTAARRTAAQRVIIGLSLFIALVTAYSGLKPVASSLMSGEYALLFAFDMIFLFVALLVLLSLGYTVFRNLDPFIDSVERSVEQIFLSSGTGNSSGGAADTDGGTITCPNCGSAFQPGTDFCGNCGTALSSTD